MLNSVSLEGPHTASGFLLACIARAGRRKRLTRIRAPASSSRINLGWTPARSCRTSHSASFSRIRCC